MIVKTTKAQLNGHVSDVITGTILDLKASQTSLTCKLSHIGVISQLFETGKAYHFKSVDQRVKNLFINEIMFTVNEKLESKIKINVTPILTRDEWKLDNLCLTLINRLVRVTGDSACRS